MPIDWSITQTFWNIVGTMWLWELLGCGVLAGFLLLPWAIISTIVFAVCYQLLGISLYESYIIATWFGVGCEIVSLIILSIVICTISSMRQDSRMLL